MIFAEVVAAGPAEWLDIASRFGIAGVLGVLLWFLLVKHVPQIEQRHETERKEWRAERQSWQEYLRKRDDDIVGLMTELKSQNARILDKLE